MGTWLTIIRREMQILKMTQIYQKKLSRIEKKKNLIEENQNKEVIYKQNLKNIEDEALIVMRIMKDLELQKEKIIKLLDIKKSKVDLYRRKLDNIKTNKGEQIDKIKEIRIRKMKTKEKYYFHKENLKKDFNNV